MTHREVRGHAVWPILKRLEGRQVLHRASFERPEVDGVGVLPVIPDLVDHLKRRGSGAQCLIQREIDSQHDGKRRWALCMRSLSMYRSPLLIITRTHAPFTENVG